MKCYNEAGKTTNKKRVNNKINSLIKVKNEKINDQKLGGGGF
jgi:hypothetical protein